MLSTDVETPLFTDCPDDVYWIDRYGCIEERFVSPTVEDNKGVRTLEVTGESAIDTYLLYA